MAQIDKYKKVSFNGGTILGIIITFIIIGGLFFLMIPTEKERIYAEYNNSLAGESTLPKNHNLNKVSLKKLDKKVEKMDEDEYLIVYYGNADCSGCLANLGTIVNKTQNILKVDEVLYLDSTGDFTVTELRETLGNDKIGDKTPEIWVFQGEKLIVSTADFYNEEDGIKWDTFWLRVEHLMLSDNK